MTTYEWLVDRKTNELIEKVVHCSMALMNMDLDNYKIVHDNLYHAREELRKHIVELLDDAKKAGK